MNATATLKCSPNLIDAARAQAFSLGYPSFNAYLVALLRIDIMKPGDHEMAKKIAGRPSRKRDAIDAGLLLKAEESLAQWQAVEDSTDDEVRQAMIAHQPPDVLPFGKQRAS